jgi:hypothetical protein
VQTSKTEFPLEYRECLFQVVKAGQYQALKYFKKELEQNQMSFENYKLETKSLMMAKVNMEKEMENNKQSSIVDHGKPILFGDSVLLFHIQRFEIKHLQKSQKFLTVAKQNSDLQKDALKIALTGYPDRYAYFSILPSVKVKLEGEKVTYSF